VEQEGEEIPSHFQGGNEVFRNCPTWHLTHELECESKIVPSSHEKVGMWVGADEGKKHSKEFVELEHVNEPSHENFPDGHNSQLPFKRFAG